MSIEFRNAIFGFNKDDVLNYDHIKDSELKALSNKLNARICELNSQLEELKAEHLSALGTIGQISKENSSLKAKVDEFEQKSKEIEVIGSKIGKLYLVSKATAKTIVDKATENSEIVSAQTNKNLENIEITQSSLKEIAEEILSASKSVVSRFDELQNTLSDVKAKVNGNNNDAVQISEEFVELYEKLG